MNRLSDQEVDRIARELAGRLSRRAAVAPPAVAASGAAASGAAATSAGGGVFATVDACIAAARKAFQELQELSLQKRGEIIAAYREAMRAKGADLAREAWQETGLGRYEDKVAKNRLVTDKTPGTEALRPVATSGDDGLSLTEWAPFGVIGAITPTTNPTSTIICNAIGMVAAGNAVVFNAHPGARRCSLSTVRHLDAAAIAAGGPPNLVVAVAEPTIESATALMRHAGINLLVVTGGPGVVQAAMTSGKRAVCAGPGNPPVVVDETADLAKAGRDVLLGASFDNNVICVDEKEVFVTAAAADRFLESLRAAGAYIAGPTELRRLETHIFKETRGPRAHAVINKECVGRNADVLLGLISVKVAPEVRLIAAEVPEDHPLVWTEQLMPVLPVVRVSHVARAINLAKEAEHGFGHSASMHSHDIAALSRMARDINTSIFVKNGPIIAGLGAGGEGFTSYTIASPTGEGMTSPLSFSRQRRCVLVDHFRIV
ncbi:MAG TPA: aldehyde dehydrogenase EutE [Candidatus Krumholzibacteria bacterium]|nr:aldehyde dehydrogenase EutE [Candidatus Krumholzibacteria bacterium]HPD71832.1 aldehyde dehydrogenase EutE [Candidatus Krumholzibacteria bacterium]HRY41235.1 aldehyde dehydrogenase EutE [Candidatus Krumholzibacteria bacterium]